MYNSQIISTRTRLGKITILLIHHFSHPRIYTTPISPENPSLTIIINNKIIENKHNFNDFSNDLIKIHMRQFF